MGITNTWNFTGFFFQKHSELEDFFTLKKVWQQQKFFSYHPKSIITEHVTYHDFTPLSLNSKEK